MHTQNKITLTSQLLALLMLLALLQPVHANNIPEAFSQWLTGTTTDNQPSTASFSIGITADGEKFDTAFAKWQVLDVLSDIRVAPEHLGKSGAVYLVARYNNDWFMKNSTSQWVSWDLQIASLVPHIAAHPLQATESVVVEKRLTLLPGKFLVYVGYKVNGVIHYNQQAAPFSVNTAEKPTDTLNNPVGDNCTAPQVLQNNVCVTPAPTCTAPAVLDNGVCVTPPTDL